MAKRAYDSTVAIAGNIARGIAEPAWRSDRDPVGVAMWCVALARAIVAEVERTEPSATPPPTETT